MLWRRANTNESDGKIYCLVEADKLNYGVAERVDQKLENMFRPGSLSLIVNAK